jgi:hypothetical protein
MDYDEPMLAGRAGMLARSGVALLVPLALSCGSSHTSTGFLNDASVRDAGSDGQLSGLLSIALSPTSATIQAGDTPSSQAFTATGSFSDGSSRNITSFVSWTISPAALLKVTGGVVSPTGAAGGYGTVEAVAGSITGTASVRVTLTEMVLESGAPSGSASDFNGTDDPTQAPQLAYPLDGALIPPNLPTPEFQWLPAANTTAFDVHLSSPILDVHLYTRCNAIGTTGGCGLTPDGTTWSAIVSTISGDVPVTVTVLGAGASPGKFGTSASRSLQLASSDLTGGLYYFNTDSASLPDSGTAQAGIFRYDFVRSAGGPFYTAGQCAGCHALSHDGTKMLATICTLERGCGDPLQLGVVSVSNVDAGIGVTPYPAGDSTIQDWTPDATYYVTSPSCTQISSAPPNDCVASSGGGLNLVTALTGTIVGAVPTGTGAVHPAFATDGSRLVYARGNPYNSPLSITAASLYTINFLESPTPMWGTEKVLVQSAGENNYYPTFSPDNAWVLFARSQCNAGDPPSACDSYDDPSAHAVVVPSSGGTPITLANANGTGLLDNSWPRWAPFAGSYKEGNLFWFTFSSIRDYGFHVIEQPNGYHVRQLWLVAFDPAKAKAGMDPSFAPMWLGFQDPSSSNHTAQWTTVVVTPQ